jgi:hypothetical protein
MSQCLGNLQVGRRIVAIVEIGPPHEFWGGQVPVLVAVIVYAVNEY